MIKTGISDSLPRSPAEGLIKTGISGSLPRSPGEG
jgi:hypothetical protein